MKIIINADDFGYSIGHNQGIIQAHLGGVVTSTTILMNANATEDAIARALEYPSLGVGVHCVLNLGKPILKAEQVPSLVDENGDFKKHNHNQPLEVDLDEVYKEWKAQIDLALESGLKIDHLDSHKHMHLHPTLFETFIKLAQLYRLPIRYIDNENSIEQLEVLNRYEVEYVYALTDFYLDNLSPDYFKDIASKAKGKSVIEVMCHPAIVDEVIMKNSSYNLHRAQELETLIHSQTKEYLKDFELITFSQFSERSRK